MNKKIIYFNALVILSIYQSSTASFLLGWFKQNPEDQTVFVAPSSDMQSSQKPSILKKRGNNRANAWLDVSLDPQDQTTVHCETIKRFVVINSNYQTTSIPAEGRQKSTKEFVREMATKRSASLPGRQILDQNNPTTKKHRSRSQVAKSN